MMTTLLSVLVALTALSYVWLKIPKTAFVDLAQLFEEFDGKKELLAQLNRLENRQKTLLDSVALDIRSLQHNVSNGGGQVVLAKLGERQNVYQQLDQEFSNQYQRQDQELAAQVWKQINQYVIDFGKENGYDYIYGTSGNGSLMYGSSGNNITPKILEYINDRYEGI